MTHRLEQLAAIFGQLALLAVGGVNTVVPEMQRQVVQVHGWMPAHEFTALFALAQAAPGPNMLVATLVGWQVAGLAGAAVATFSLVAPACLLTFVVSGAWQRFRAARWRVVVQAGLTPVTVGLLLAAAAVLARGAVHSVDTVLRVKLVKGHSERNRMLSGRGSRRAHRRAACGRQQSE